MPLACSNQIALASTDLCIHAQLFSYGMLALTVLCHALHLLSSKPMLSPDGVLPAVTLHHITVSAGQSAMHLMAAWL